ncbi:MAG: hypothetical protein CMC70_05135 [Flavobacteriaceae bacterium]|nr:hypothetical protein [Flavobacteriaceae bacterium]
MPLTKLQFKPGVNRETTSYSNEGGWFDIDKTRFRFGFPEKIGGWTRYAVNAFLGSCRSLHPWVALDGTQFLGVGTHLKYYINEGGGYNDITPVRATTTNGIVFAATNGSSTITATDDAHGASIGDFVTISGAVSLGGLITADVLNQEYQVVLVPTANTFTFVAREADTSIASITTTSGLNPTPVVANSSDTGNGGSGADAAYQVTVGLDTSLTGNGWNAGSYGRGTWNSASNLSVQGATLRIWSHDNFGEDLILNARDAGIFYWDRTNGTTTRAVALSSLASSNLAPTIAKKVLVSDRDRHIIAFGCDPESAIGTQDPLLIRFGSQESLTDWQTLPTNTAGELRIGSGSEIITAIETRQQVIVFTDESLHAMQFLGPPFTFGINTISENITIAGPLAAIAVEDMVFWMGKQEFYVYGGGVQRLPCTVRDFVFNDFNELQIEKVTAATNTSFSEVWWFYPSGSSQENDRYVIYNYQQKIWYFGTLARTVWLDRGIESNPVAAGTDHYLYTHESGLDDGSTDPVSAISAFVESSQVDIGDGNQFSFVNKIIPDLTFRDSTASSPAATLTLKARNFPGGAYLQTNGQSVSQTVAGTSTVVEQFTDQINLRLRGRSLALKIASSDTGVTWRLGSPRIDIKPDGRR